MMVSALSVINRGLALLSEETVFFLPGLLCAKKGVKSADRSLGINAERLPHKIMTELGCRIDCSDNN